MEFNENHLKILDVQGVGNQFSYLSVNGACNDTTSFGINQGDIGYPCVHNEYDMNPS